jgi:sensor histidine kinase YesM
MNASKAPYVVIALLCVVMGFVRYSVIPQWPWYYHLLAYSFQVLLISGVWKLSLHIYKNLQKRFDLYKTPVRAIFFQVFVSMVIVSPVFVASFYFARPYLPPYVNTQYLTLLYVLAYFVLLMINFGFFAHRFFLDLRKSLEEKAALQLEAEKLEKEKMLMQYHHLKNQVNPHFLFNTLTSLDGLIHTNPDLASDFVKHLSKVYRYVLEHKEKEVVSLEKELAFIEHYMELLKIRFNSSLQFEVRIADEALDKGIVMVTLQMLIDNALKHNSLSHQQPLLISICAKGNTLRVRNNKQLRKQIDVSTKQGLQQLCQLYQFYGEQKVVIKNEADYFEITLPLL